MLTLIIIAIIITAIILLIPKSKNTLKKEQVEEEKPKHRIETHYVWLVDSQNVARFEKAYKQFYEENSDYFLPARELKDYYSYEKVYKFEPYELPLKMEKLDVYSYIEEGEWLKIGRVKKTADIEGRLKLYIFPNIYKYVTEDSVEKESDDSYFGLEVTQVVEL